MAAAAVAILLPVALRADLTGTVTLQSGSTFSFDTGATAASGGDILFTGTNITFQGSATGYSFTAVGATEYSGLSQSLLSGFPSSLYTQSAISGGALVVNEVFAVHTIGGNYAKVLVTAVSSSSITFQYDTFGVSGGGGGGGGGSTTPQITAVVNNSSLIPAGFSNSGIAPSTLFVIEGTNLANAGTPSLWNVVQSQLPLTQNGASISVTVGGTTVHPAIYYTCSGALGSASGCGTTAPAASMIAAVLPSGTPTGQGTLTVTYTERPARRRTFRWYRAPSESTPTTAVPA
jgi:hypothetical protein